MSNIYSLINSKLKYILLEGGLSPRIKEGSGKSLLFGFTRFLSFFYVLFFICYFCNAEGSLVKVVLKPYREIVLSARVHATIKAYHVEEGEQVNKGQLLVELDDQIYRQLHMQSKAAFEEAKAEKEYAEQRYKQKVQLFQKGFAGRNEVDKCKRDAAVALSKYEGAAAALKRTKIDLSSCFIKAPFAGRVVKKIKHVHEYIKAGDPILQLVDDNRLYAVIHFPSIDIYKIKEGMKLKIKITETGKEYTVTVTEKSANIDPASRTFEVKASLDNADNQLRAGMSGYLINKSLNL